MWRCGGRGVAVSPVWCGGGVEEAGGEWGGRGGGASEGSPLDFDLHYGADVVQSTPRSFRPSLTVSPRTSALSVTGSINEDTFSLLRLRAATHCHRFTSRSVSPSSHWCSRLEWVDGLYHLPCKQLNNSRTRDGHYRLSFEQSACVRSVSPSSTVVCWCECADLCECGQWWECGQSGQRAI